MPSLPSFSADLFCGFGTNDLMGFYGEYSSTSFSRSQSTPTFQQPRNIGTTSGKEASQSKPTDLHVTPVTPPANKKWVPADLFTIK
ncbi:hypothetical protein HNW13_018340 [Shewanella sp. BF02_Schw]|uniref:hypothetical protein n=1 Tax=Shewanella sp. BF02_Schw TaxID=394908 RepID=UPI001AA0EE6E|nr:hypothetical protein [Shewanella sp. BF02_Schw]MBO1897701.1 hypothetical protein [Shewanella sp. BF02_Schw]